MRNIVVPLYSKIAYIISAVGLFLYLLIWGMEESGNYIYLFGEGSEKILLIIGLIVAALIVSANIVSLVNNPSQKGLFIAITVVVWILAIMFLFGSVFLGAESKFFEYTSDDKTHTIVVEEKSFLLFGGGTIYEKTSFCTMKKVGSYSTDDGFRPFTNDAFYFVWNEDDFELHYAFFGRSDEEYRVEKMNYAK